NWLPLPAGDRANGILRRIAASPAETVSLTMARKIPASRPTPTTEIAIRIRPTTTIHKDQINNPLPVNERVSGQVSDRVNDQVNGQAGNNPISNRRKRAARAKTVSSKINLNKMPKEIRGSHQVRMDKADRPDKTRKTAKTIPNNC